jgi:hypothetical protein
LAAPPYPASMTAAAYANPLLVDSRRECLGQQSRPNRSIKPTPGQLHHRFLVFQNCVQQQH